MSGSVDSVQALHVINCVYSSNSELLVMRFIVAVTVELMCIAFVMTGHLLANNRFSSEGPSGSGDNAMH